MIIITMENETKIDHDMPQDTQASGSITSNVVAATTTTLDVPHYKNLLSSILNTARSGPEEDIHSFLARPSILGNGLFETTNGANTDLITIDLPSAFTGKYVSGTLTGGLPLIKDKLRGFMGFRSDFKIRVQVNANKFQQGMLLLHFVPFTSNQSSEAASWNYSLIQKSQHYSTVFDISCDTEVEISIPFVYPGPYFDYSLDSTWGYTNIGKFYVTVYSPLLYGTGSPNAEITVWGSMENVTLVGPVVPYAQSSDFSTSKKTVGVIDKEKRPGGTEKTSSSTGAILTSVGEIAKRVPLLSSFAQPLKWFARMVDEPAAYFGFSVPNMTIAPMMTMRNNLPWYNNADQPRLTNVLGVNSDNAIGHLPGFAGSEIDEMAIATIAQRYSYTSQTEWNTTTAIDYPLLTYRLCPNDMYVTTTVGSTTIYSFPPVGYVSQMFHYWRGSIKLRIRVVKTEFHSGRLLVSFNPGLSYTNVTTNMTNDNSQYTYRHIIDIRDGNEFELIFPYISAHQWIQFDDCIGRVRINVLNPLRAPDTVSPSVSLITELAGGEDIEFAVPRLMTTSVYTPVTYGAFASMEKAEESDMNAELVEPVAQSDVCGITSSTIGGALIAPDDGAACGYTIGEKITSLRQICKRNQLQKFASTTNTLIIDLAPLAFYGKSSIGASVL